MRFTILVTALVPSPVWGLLLLRSTCIGLGGELQPFLLPAVGSSDADALMSTCCSVLLLQDEFTDLCRMVNNGKPSFPGNFVKAFEDLDT